MVSHRSTDDEQQNVLADNNNVRLIVYKKIQQWKKQDASSKQARPTICVTGRLLLSGTLRNAKKLSLLTKWNSSLQKYLLDFDS